MNRLFAGILLAASLNAATIINPPPLGEGDTLAIVMAACPTCERVSDDLDTSLLWLPPSSYYVLAFEDLQGPTSDRDFNDLIVWIRTGFGGSVIEWGEIASFSAADTQFRYGIGQAWADSTGSPGVGPAWMLPSANADGLDHVVTWTLPADLSEVPEPATWLLFGAGLLGLAAVRRETQGRLE